MKNSAVYEGNKRALVAAILLIVLLFSASYAFFTSLNNAKAGFQTGLGSALNVTYTLTAGQTINLELDPSILGNSSVGNSVSETAPGTDTVMLTNSSTYTNLTCSYEVWYEPTAVYTNSSANTSGEVEMELLIENLHNPGYSVTLDLNGISTPTKVTTVDISTNDEVSSVTHNWMYTLTHYNRSFDQASNIGKTFGGKVYFKSLGCEEKLTPDNHITLSNTVLALEIEDDYTSSQDGTIYRVVDQNGVRYEGKDPDNYVYYNCTNDNDTSTCEKWRIIGTFDGADIGLTSGKKYTKIARSTPLDTRMAWDTGQENDWVNSSLNAYLNGTYLNSLSSTAQGMIAKENKTYSGWHLLGPNNSNYDNLYSQYWYQYERNASYGAPGLSGTALGYTNAAIGLMYPSDYGYAAYGESCDNETTDALYYYDENCGAVDWLMYEGYYEWLISPSADFSSTAFYVSGNDGGYVYYADVSSEYAVRPVLYLEASVSLDGGNGTSASPYILK